MPVCCCSKCHKPKDCGAAVSDDHKCGVTALNIGSSSCTHKLLTKQAEQPQCLESNNLLALKSTRELASTEEHSIVFTHGVLLGEIDARISAGFGF
jgi:hypothetical protein